MTADHLLGLRRHLRPAVEVAWHLDPRPGGMAGSRRGNGLEVVDVRGFFPGDDIRHIDRNVSARTGSLHVRSFREERGATLMLVADFRRFMLWGTRRALRSVVAAEALALAAWRGLEAGARVSLYAFDGGGVTFVPPQSRAAGMAALAGGLQKAHDAALTAARDDRSEPDLDRALEAAAHLAATDANFILATGLDNEGTGFSAFAGTLGRFGRLQVVLVKDAFEEAAPTGLYPYVDLDGGTKWALVGSGGDKMDNRQERLEALGVRVLPVDGNAGPEALARSWEGPDGRAR